MSYSYCFRNNGFLFGDSDDKDDKALVAIIKRMMTKMIKKDDKDDKALVAIIKRMMIKTLGQDCLFNLNSEFSSCNNQVELIFKTPSFKTSVSGQIQGKTLESPDKGGIL